QTEILEQRIAEICGQRKSLLAIRKSASQVASKLCELRCRDDGGGARRGRIATTRQCEKLPQPRHSFAHRSADLPQEQKSSREAQAKLSLLQFHRPCQRRLNVRIFGIELGRRCLSPRPTLVRVDVPVRNKGGYRKRMAPPHAVAFAAGNQVLLGILTHR